MSDYDKLKAIGNYILDNYDYGVTGFWYVSLVSKGKTDCSVSSCLFVDVATKDLGLKAEQFMSTGITWPGHFMAKIWIGNTIYLFDASAQGTAGNRGKCTIRAYNAATFEQEATRDGFIGDWAG